jgi:outer membrane lipoprotein-sorting protein
MTKRIPLLAALSLAAALLAPAAHAGQPDLNDIVARSLAVNKVVDSTSNATFTLINKEGQQRVRKTYGVSKLEPNGHDNMRMTRFLEPGDIKGTVSLLKEHSAGDDDMWIYLPALKKVRRLVSSNKKDSFVGTDFSYGDVIGHKVADWNYKLVKEEPVDGADCYLIEATPRSDDVRDNSGYSRRQIWIRKDNYYAIRGEMWDEAGQPYKKFHMTDVKEVDPARHKWQAMTMEAEDLQTGHKTIISFENYKANQKVPDAFFTTRYMEKE